MIEERITALEAENTNLMSRIITLETALANATSFRSEEFNAAVIAAIRKARQHGILA